MTVTGFDSDDLSALEIASTGGAPCPLPVLEYFQGKGVPFQGGHFFHVQTHACAKGPARPCLQVSLAKSSSATTGLMAVCQTTHW